MKPEDGYIAYIVNPKSGASSRKLTSRKFGGYLAKKGYEVKFELTKSLEHACELATDAAVDYECALVVAVGGDGIIREVAHGLEGSDKPLLVIPAGTENLLANELGFDGRLKTTIKTFEAGYTRPLDLGCVNGKCFTSIAGFGFDGTVVKNVSENRLGHITYFDYFWPIWRTFWNYKFSPIHVEVDGEEIFNGRGLVFVGNISRYALGLQILGKADYGDGLLDICIYDCDNKICLMKHSAMTLLKKHTNAANVIYLQGKNIKVTSNSQDIETEIDGDPGPSLPVEINILPQAVNVMVPEHGKPAGIKARFMRILE